MQQLSMIKYKNRFYKSLHNLYLLNKTDESPSYEAFRRKYFKKKSISLALKKPYKLLKSKHYVKLYEENKTENSVSMKLFIRRMRKGAQLHQALNRKVSKTLQTPVNIDGGVFFNLRKLAEAYEISHHTVNSRYRRGLRGKKLVKGSPLISEETN